MRMKKRYENTIGIILLPIVLLLFSFTFLVFNTTYTEFLLTKYSTNSTAVPVTHQLIDYFQNQAEMPEIFAENEQEHLRDVKRVIWGAIISFFIFVIILTYCIAYGNRYLILKKGSIVLIAIIILAAIIPFDILFDVFHKIFFPQGNYMFLPDSTLIQFYPQQFFTAYAVSIAVLALIADGILFLLEIVSRKG